jgi:hypothetical protein
MPRISEFYGIVIWMFHDDHDPAHFHAEYGEYMVRIRIDTLEPVDRGFPQRALRLVREWGSLHRQELMANWQKARALQPLDKIEPLP